MKNPDAWKPTKYIYMNGKLKASRDRREVAISSRLVSDIVADLYQQNIPPHVTGKLLDLGCGKVPLYIAYKDYVSDTTCVDWENTFHKNEHLDFSCDLTKDLPFEDGKFDTIILSDVLEHIPDPENLCKEIFRILSENGKLIMNVPFFYRIHEAPHDYYRYTEFALKRFMDIAGFNVIQLKPIGGAPEIMADMFAKNIQAVPFIGKPLAIAAQYLMGLFIRTRIGRRMSQSTSQVSPLGYFLIAEKPGS
ncbi:MAG TPA: class I SAM-dependent methyltransferase [Gammaproteobacteria bacterium]